MMQLPTPPKGVSEFVITGVTRDNAGTIVPNAEVDVFNSITWEWICSVYSDEQGRFRATTPNPDPTGDGSRPVTFRIVFYKGGAPDIAGTTVVGLVSVPG